MGRIVFASFHTPLYSSEAITSTKRYAILSHGVSRVLLTFVRSQFAETPDGDMTPMRRLICGGAAGITSVTITYPLDIVRTRLSIQSASFADLGARDPAQKLPGMFTTMLMIYKNEGGSRALYRGIAPTVAGVAPYVSLCPICLSLVELMVVND